jgi:hypothetical protein
MDLRCVKMCVFKYHKLLIVTVKLYCSSLNESETQKSNTNYTFKMLLKNTAN